MHGQNHIKSLLPFNFILVLLNHKSVQILPMLRKEITSEHTAVPFSETSFRFCVTTCLVSQNAQRLCSLTFHAPRILTINLISSLTEGFCQKQTPLALYMYICMYVYVCVYIYIKTVLDSYNFSGSWHTGR